MLAKLAAIYRRHYTFLLLFCLFVSFRLLALLLFRPGGFITDFSDYDFYATWGQLAPMGYRTFVNLWTAYPPLFPALMLPVFELSSRIPPWIEPRLFFHVLFGLLLLVFETGNFVLIYRLARRLEIGNQRTEDRSQKSEDRGQKSEDRSQKLENREQRTEDNAVNDSALRAQRAPAHSALLYALLFTPVYTMLGWFEAMPLFFLLLGLDLLLSARRWGWAGSALAAALGFLTKLTPAVLVPIGVRWLGAKFSWDAARREWFKPQAPGNLARPLSYALLFLIATLGLGYWLVDGNTALAFSSFQVNSIRPPWQSIWALLDGYYGFGLVPVDMRNLVNLVKGTGYISHVPWTWVGLAFGLVYLWLYTRRYDWQQPRTPVAFSAVSVIWLFLYSKGWSPQFLVWVLAFIVLLMPTLRGIAYATILSLINFVEANVFLILLPNEHWLMVGTVLFRTVLLLLLLVEFLGQIWPAPVVGQQMRWVSAGLAWAVMGAALLAAVVATPRAAQAYQARRLAEQPCRSAIEQLQTQSEWPNRLIASDQSEVWRDFYPWLRQRYTIRIIDGYNPYDRPQPVVIAEQLQKFVQNQEFWWLTEKGVGSQANKFFADPKVRVLERQTLGACKLARVLRLDQPPLAVAAVAGGPIQLLHYEMDAPKVGETLHLVLYWQADQKVAASYTVFTQLFDAAGKLVAQQDNLPGQGQAPTDQWAAQTLVRDPYRLVLPPNAPVGAYHLLVGLYDAQGRRPLTLPDGTTADHLSFDLNIGKN